VTGVQTIIDDDPSLAVRAGELDVEEADISAGIARPIVILDPELRIPRDARVLANHNAVVACLEDPANGVKLDCEKMILPSDGARRIDLVALLKRLAQMECNEVLFECGATLAGAMIEQHLVDELVLYVAPTLFGADGRSLLKLAKIDSMEERVDFEIADLRHIGNDIRLTYVPKPR